jgi:hypothetical protein
MTPAFIPAHEKAVAHVFSWADQAHQVHTLPIAAWQMMPQGGGRFVARPVFTVDVGSNTRIGVVSCWGVITEDAIYQDQVAFERSSIELLNARSASVQGSAQ